MTTDIKPNHLITDISSVCLPSFIPPCLPPANKKEVICIIPPQTRFNTLITDEKIPVISRCKNASILHKIIYEAISYNYPKNHVFLMGVLPLHTELMNLLNGDCCNDIKKFDVNYLVISKDLIKALKGLNADIVKFYIGKVNETFVSETLPTLDMISTSHKCYDNEIKYCPYSLRVDLNLI